MVMNALGFTLLLLGFLGGAYVSVATKDADLIAWPQYAVAAGLMFAGLVLRLLARRGEAEAHEVHEGNLDALEDSLVRLQERLREYAALDDDQALARLHERIDKELVDPLEDFVEARETMITRLGMQQYADIMSAFATGERLINRAWSASADGYVDEVRNCVSDSLGEMLHAAELLQAARHAEPSGAPA